MSTFEVRRAQVTIRQVVPRSRDESMVVCTIYLFFYIIQVDVRREEGECVACSRCISAGAGCITLSCCSTPDHRGQRIGAGLFVLAGPSCWQACYRYYLCKQCDRWGTALSGAMFIFLSPGEIRMGKHHRTPLQGQRGKVVCFF